MANCEWRIDQPHTHVIRLEHGYWSGRVAIWLDEELIYRRDLTLVDFGLEYWFELDGVEATIRIRCHLLCYYSYQLRIEEQVIELADSPGRRL